MRKTLISLFVMTVVAGAVANPLYRELYVRYASKGVQGFTPNDIDGIITWLDGADISTITTSGVYITEWRDKSPNQYIMRSATTNTQPQYFTTITNTINGILCPYFNGANFMTQTVNIASSLTNNPAFTVFFVVRKKIGVTGKGASFGWGDPNETAGGFGFYDNNESLVVYAYGGNRNYPIVGNIPLDATYLHEYRKTPGAINTTSLALTNGVPTSSGTPTSGTPAIRSNPLTVGRWANQTTDALQGMIGEFVLYGRDLTDDERTQVREYLADKWGVTLP